MKNKNKLMLGIISIFIIILFVNAEEISFNVCCEKTKNGAWCLNTLEKNCDSSIDSLTKAPYRKTPTSCEATSFCKPGCCIDSQEGLCMENTPERVCKNSGGVWADDSECNVPQCSLGCCILGEQASFVTLTRCKRLSSLYGLETNFKKNIADEASCILITQLQDKGACVFESEFQKTCKFTTREVCSGIKPSGNVTSKTSFYKDYLCSADELAANCGPTTETMCVEGKEEVYFKDSCGNPANIYDAGKIREPSYWKKIVPKAQSCALNFNRINQDSKTCGNCDYFSGSICKKGSASYGEYSCKDLNCYNTENGKDYKNGESWCVYQGNTGEGRDAVGSRHFRHICINGEEIIEACDDYRAKVCIEGKIQTSKGNFAEAACRANRWTDCINQDEKDDCENTDQRDCYWREGYYFKSAGTSESSASTSNVPSKSGDVFGGGATGGFSGGSQASFGGGATGKTITGFATEGNENEPNILEGEGACLPDIPPGLKFWNKGDASGICNLGSSICIVTYEKNLLGKASSIKNEDCRSSNGKWVKAMNDICKSLGDCGAYVNVAGKFTSKGAELKVSGTKKVLDGLYQEMKNKAGI
jgi:hypothetical protein